MSFTSDLSSADIPGITVTTRLTAAVDWSGLIQHTLEYSSDQAVNLFACWLAAKIIKGNGKETLLNGRKVPSKVDQIIDLIKKPDGF